MKPSGPSWPQILTALPQLMKRPFDVFAGWQRRFGDVVFIPNRKPPTLHLSIPEDIRHVLATNPLNYRKTGALVIGKELLGQGLVVSREPLHGEERDLMKGHFTKSFVSGYTDAIVKNTLDHIRQWKGGSTIESFGEMSRLTLAIVGAVYFTTDFRPISDELRQSFNEALRFIQRTLNVFPVTTPTPSRRRYLRAVRFIDETVYGMIDERLGMDNRPRDLLTTLLEAHDRNGAPLPRTQVRDEVVNIMAAGYDTNSTALAWTWNFLSDHPSVEKKFHDELSSVLGGRSPKAEDLPKLQYTEMVFNESLRLRPPAWIIARMSLEDDQLPSGVRIPAGTQVVILPYVAHRNAQRFSDPEKFDPERFRGPVKQERPPFEFFPFGGGPRGCIGETFARTEALIILSTIAQRFRLKTVSEQPPIVPAPMIALRPKNGIRVTLHDRPPTAQPESNRVRSGVHV